ncbi:TlpA family protein disulfide reductase [Lacibacter cauensis]|nr:TlpA disulfide reductase family protein [Lacibacter cauensis]
MKRLVILMLAITVAITQANTQQLQPGDKLPDLVFQDVLNYPFDYLSLNDFKEKILIIDFWNTRCVACFKAFPKLDSLKQYFGDRVEVVLVNSESKEYTQDFFKKRPSLYKPRLPMITDGNRLSDLFPVDGYPYSAWIKNGVVKYYSGTHAITKETINRFLNGNDMVFRDPTLIKFTSSVDIHNYDYFSSISRCSDSINVGSTEAVKVKQGTAVAIASNCYSIRNLYCKAYGENGKYNFNKKYNVVLDVIDRFKYEYPVQSDSLDQWMRDYAYSYELLLPKEKTAKAYSIMQQDLARYFNLNASVELVNMDVLVLRKRNGVMKLNTKKIMASGDSVIQFNQIPFDQFGRELAVRIEQTLPIFIEAFQTEPVTCAIRYQSLYPLKIVNLRKDLSEAGFELIVDKRDVPVLFLRERLQTKQPH